MASSMGAGKVITDGLIFYVDASNNKSYPGSGTNTTNLGRNTSTASLVNGVAYNSSYGGSFFFDGTNDYISCGDSNFQITGNSLSIESCFYYDGLDKTNVPILAKRNSNAPFNQFSVVMSNGNLYTGGTGKVLSMFLRPDESSNQGPPDPKDRGCTYTLPSAGIYHVIGVNDSTSARLFVNGVLVATTTSSQTPNNFTISGYDFRIGNNNASSYFTGSLQFVKLYNRALSADEVLQNYESTRERFGLRGIAIDPDASLFLQTAGITDTTQQSAIDTLVLELKNAGIWSKMKAIYPFVGGTASTHKWNLKDPRDLDAAFRLTFSGGWTHSSTGSKANGTNGYADTFLTPATSLSQDSCHISYYATVGWVTNGMNMGTSNNTINQGLYLYGPFGAGYTDDYSRNNNSTTVVTSLTNGGGTNGLFINNRNSSTTFSVTRNGGTPSSKTASSNGRSNYSVWLNATNNTGGGNVPYYTDNTFGFATIGDGLTATEASSLYTIVQKYQTTLGRQV
jgi:hypothetical protein